MQFLHAESYGRSSPKKARDRRWTVRDIIAELIREPGSHPHVDAPKLPQIIYGDQPEGVERRMMAAAEAAVDPIGRKLRRDAQILVAGVASYPVPVARMADEDWVAFQRWERDTVTWLGQQYGTRLKSVVRHTDERFPHLHWLAVPDLAAGERVDAADPGKRAIANAKAEGIKQKRLLDQRYRAAMRAWQDDYWQAVGSKHRLERAGPQRQRLTRSAWHSEREAAQVATRLASERDLLTVENARLTAENGRLLSALDAVAKRARSVVRSLLQIGGEKPGDDVPSWLESAEWAGVLRKVRAFTAAAALRAGVLGTASTRVIDRDAERVR